MHMSCSIRKAESSHRTESSPQKGCRPEYRRSSASLPIDLLLQHLFGVDRNRDRKDRQRRGTGRAGKHEFGARLPPWLAATGQPATVLPYHIDSIGEECNNRQVSFGQAPNVDEILCYHEPVKTPRKRGRSRGRPSFPEGRRGAVTRTANGIPRATLSFLDVLKTTTYIFFLGVLAIRFLLS